MAKHFNFGIVVITVGMIAAGCVSSGTFQKMEEGKNEEITALKQHKIALEDQQKSLEQKNALLEQDNSTLRQKVAEVEKKIYNMEQAVGSLFKKMETGKNEEIAALQQDNAVYNQQIASLERQNAAMAAAIQQRQQQYDALVQGLAKEVEKGQLQVRQYQNMLAVDLAEQIFFDSGRAKLKPGGKEVLKKVGEALKRYDNKIIRVVGHTDNVPVAKSLQGTFPTNWELSVARATNVVRFLQEVGIPPERMAASGRSQYDPVASNVTPEGRQKNRRIEILLIDKTLMNEMIKSEK
ncbi:MAG: OmpA family protein [Nitrospiria bacterium]